MAAQLTGGSSHRTPMRFEDFVALGETKHHEYYDGLCVVNPPSLRHVLVTKRLCRLLDDACPPGFTSYPEAGWRVSDRVLVEPDVMVAPTASAGGDVLRDPPMLVVEIESPSTRDVDRGRKRELYGSGGAAWYWIVDLDVPELVVFHNDGVMLLEVQRIGPAGREVTAGPFTTSIDLAALTAP